ncbi:hypothetical protein [Spirosoma spitsbergense]|uniref:hypothetical protein n=1 Tax=Spirosoma spitsbergense TaxID=431554 RepID=UPI00036023D0|nr:hypothetical protein [Spirosoma spitsbergense]
MEDLVRYKSFDELKASSEPIDTDVERVRERHNKYRNFMRFLRQKRAEDSPAPDKNSSQNTDAVNGV